MGVEEERLKFDNFQLSQAQLLFMLRAINLPDIPGLGEKPWGDAELEEARQDFRNAGVELNSAGMVWLDDNGNQPVAESALQKVLVTCAYPQQMAALSYQERSEGSVQIFHYRRDGLDVLQDMPKPANHGFVMKTDSDMGEKIVSGLFGSYNWEIESQQVMISQEIYEKSVEIAKTDKQQARDLLISAGVSAEISDDFLSGMSEQVLKVHNQCVYRFSPTVDQKIVTIIASERVCWLIEKNLEEKIMQIKAMNSLSLQKFVSDVYKKFVM